MEPLRRPAGQRALLPAEVEICQILGITEQDYWYFVDLAQSYNGERNQGYELIPEVSCGPATPYLINLAIGLVLTGLGVLLAPKPKPFDQKAPPQLKTADAIGAKRFATQAGFNTVQSVASLGEIIPLVFANRANNKGGVRAASRLLWSRMTSWGTTQQFEGIHLFSAGNLAARPDFDGFAIGDSLITSYPLDKLRLLFNTNGERLIKTVNSTSTGKGQYPETQTTDTRIPGNGFEFFRPSVGPTPDFCGTRTPSSQTQFGAYAPMPNGMQFQLPYELVLIPDGQGREVKKRAQSRRNKINTVYSIGASITAVSGNIASKGATVTYTVKAGLYDEEQFDDWGNEDIKQEQESRRIEIDANIGFGSSYLVGQTLTTCKGISSDEPYNANLSKTYEFVVSEASSGNNVEIAGIDDKKGAYEALTIQRVATATITNSRPCNVTELGIKSNVWKQINFANVNTQPSSGTISDFEDEGGNISLGQVSKYIDRYSFFTIQARMHGSDAWTNLLGPTNIFCIKGNTPRDQYNYLLIEHPIGQYEFRFVPVPGNSIYKFWVDQPGIFKAYQLRPGTPQGPLQVLVAGAGTFSVYFAGTEISLTGATFFNKEWIVGPNLDDLSQSLNPYDALADYIKYQGESTSHSSAPEHSVVYVNEVIYNDDDLFNGAGPQYDNLAIAGLNLWSDKEWSTLSELSAFIKKGVEVTKPVTGAVGPTNLLPEIVYALLTDERLGAGKLVGAAQVDEQAMADAARYCQANDFTWDGVINDRINLRDWIFQNAGYCLLDFTIIGGKFSLRPSPVIKNNGEIDRQGKPAISALFTDGVIKDLKVVFLEPEDRKPFKAVCLCREDTENGFPETRVVTVQLQGASHDLDPEETFDMTGFCSVSPGAEATHAITFAKTAILTRTLITHSVTFQTTPQMAMGLIPGQYFRLVSEATHTSRFNNGAVSDDGVLSSTTELSNGSYSIYYWTPGTTGVLEGSLNVSNGTATPRNIVYTLRNSVTEDRIYKLEALTYADDGLVEVTGSHVPLTNSGALAVMQESGFKVESK